MRIVHISPQGAILNNGEPLENVTSVQTRRHGIDDYTEIQLTVRVSDEDMWRSNQEGVNSVSLRSSLEDQEQALRQVFEGRIRYAATVGDAQERQRSISSLIHEAEGELANLRDRHERYMRDIAYTPPELLNDLVHRIPADYDRWAVGTPGAIDVPEEVVTGTQTATDANRWQGYTVTEWQPEVINVSDVAQPAEGTITVGDTRGPWTIGGGGGSGGAGQDGVRIISGGRGWSGVARTELRDRETMRLMEELRDPNRNTTPQRRTVTVERADRPIESPGIADIERAQERAEARGEDAIIMDGVLL